ncbi:hypothetical protein GJ697_28250 [Pseudoduganella sp. FT25W]|jgi:hypothetical protein|uniref:Right handed beta helix domain-containing protein n=1 Tax=Duganella alba TaxID=2666081 RepID=A0A6L5QPW5_9BURK|nr:right-handed parallel beta-helix repeat-containing protein [Duganella alba]MRX11727.1 hypothetical protein [Duganella alba]MRX20116.1 hypothetical protein [Duganella alba]
MSGRLCWGVCLLIALSVHAQVTGPAATRPESSGCQPLMPRSNADQEAAITGPGRYCVVQDFRQPQLSGGGHSGPRYGHALIVVDGGDVTIDLQQHTLHTAARSHGVYLAAAANRGQAERSGATFGASNRNVTVRNGVIDLRGTGTGVRLVDVWRSEDLFAAPAVPAYQKTRYVLENLTIRTDNVGIRLEGDGNIVRNCVIESDGDAAVVMAGANSQILNNTIVLGNPLVPTWTKASEGSDVIGLLSKTPAARTQARAAIVLHDGAGSVIQGNRIEVKGKSATRRSIYLGNNSKEVLIEKNTYVDGIDAAVTTAGSSSRARDNRTVPAVGD